ncbi:hypothetical protein SD377_000256 [Cronobacter turicensis]|nr:hypothetical protein [Cronobacter turicensis]EMA1789662.1 hypothetical protein [Cronobacter turicensis]EMA1799416.1 hypothetical protein [Cronobacter turicensis]EMA1847878.1 hypothetical protein [Cronobacter turicensis]EMA1857187.1 hypothetical protein [Cronobacter turicensis]
MRVAALLIIALWTYGVSAEECFPGFSESGLIASVGKEPIKKVVKKQGNITSHQYEFRKELSTEELLSDDADLRYEPQFYLTIYEPPCAKKVKIWFYGDNKNTAKMSNVSLAGKAFEYLTGTEPAIFENKIKRFEDVQNFESFDDKADSRFIKSGDLYSIDVSLK